LLRNNERLGEDLGEDLGEKLSQCVHSVAAFDRILYEDEADIEHLRQKPVERRENPLMIII